MTIHSVHNAIQSLTHILLATIVTNEEIDEVVSLTICFADTLIRSVVQQILYGTTSVYFGTMSAVSAFAFCDLGTGGGIDWWEFGASD